MRRNGYVVGGINRILHPTMRVFDTGYAVLAGSFGEIGRGYYWNGLSDADVRLSAKGLLGRFDLSRDDRVLAALGHWLDDVASSDVLQGLDLAYPCLNRRRLFLVPDLHDLLAENATGLVIPSKLPRAMPIAKSQQEATEPIASR